MNKFRLSLSLAAIAALAACGGRSYNAPVSTATPATVATVQTAPAVVYSAGMVIESTPALRPGFGRVTSSALVVYDSGARSGVQRLTLTMDDGSIQTVDTRGPDIAVGDRVEITPQRQIRYPVASRY